MAHDFPTTREMPLDPKTSALLFIDVQMVPDIDLSAWRTLPALAGVLLLIYGMVEESR